MTESIARPEEIRATRDFILAQLRALGMPEGRVDLTKSIVLRLGTERLGPPPRAMIVALDEICDPDRVRKMYEKILDDDLAAWDDLGIDA